MPRKYIPKTSGWLKDVLKRLKEALEKKIKKPKEVKKPQSTLKRKLQPQDKPTLKKTRNKRT